MKSGSHDRNCRLVVESPQPVVQITVIDSRWRTCGSSIGRMEVSLSPGLYKVEARLGRDLWSKHVELLEPSQKVIVPPIRMKSAVPIMNGTRSHETHLDLLQSAIAIPTRKFGEGSRIFIMSRNWSELGTRDYEAPKFRLERWRGEVLLESSIQTASDPSGDAAEAISVRVNPSTYVVSFESPIGWISQAVHVRRHWESQVFILRDFSALEMGKEGETARRIPTTSVAQAMVAKNDELNAEDYELLEVAQTAIADNKVALGREVLDRIALGKYSDPLLGVLAAHILLIAKYSRESNAQELLPFRQEEFELILRNTANLLGTRHPDIIALRAESEEWPLENEVVTSPPLFVRSWRLLMERSHSGLPGLLPARLWSRVRGSMNAVPYFSWTRADSPFSRQRRVGEKKLVKVVKRAGAMSQTDTTVGGYASADNSGRSLEASLTKQPTVEDLAAYARIGRSGIQQLLSTADTVPELKARLARRAYLPSSVSDKLFDDAELDAVVKRRDK